MPRTIFGSPYKNSEGLYLAVQPIEEKKVSGNRCCFFHSREFYRQNATYTTLAI